MQSLVDKKWLKRIERGKYLIIPLEAGPKREWSALNYWGLTEQIPQTLLIETIKRKPDKEILGIRFKFITLSEKKFFGLTNIWFDNREVRITDKGKTIIDCLDHPECCGGMIEAAKGLVNGVEAGINLETLTIYAERLHNLTVFKRLGYLSEIFDLPIQDYFGRWHKQISSGYSLLDTTGKKSGRYYSKWNLRLNVSDDELTSRGY